MDSHKDLKERFVLDMHCHVAGIGAGNSGCFVSPAMQANFRFSFFLKGFDVTSQEMTEQADQVLCSKLAARLRKSRLVDGAAILAMDGVIGQDGQVDYSATELYVPNEFVAQQCALHDNFFFGASVNPNRPDCLERLEEVARQGAVLLKWLPSIQYIDPADKKIIPFYKRMRDLGIPLLTHAGHERSFTKAVHTFADPKRLAVPLEAGVTVIAAHAATTGKSEGQDNMERLLEMFPRYDNLYTDISSLTQLNKLGCLRRLLRHEAFHDRLLYGTDMPLIALPIVSPWYFPFDLKFSQMITISRTKNVLDRDVLLKQALGVPEKVFTRPAEILLRGQDHSSG